MRLALVFAIATVMGLSAGVLTGRVVSGGTQPDSGHVADSAQPDHLLWPDEASTATSSAIRESSSDQQVSRPSGSSLLAEASSDRQVPEHVGVTTHEIGLVPVASVEEGSAWAGQAIQLAADGQSFVQVSRRTPATFRLFPTGDANLDGVVTVADLQLVARALGRAPTANPVVDWNADQRVDVLDLALVARHLD